MELSLRDVLPSRLRLKGRATRSTVLVAAVTEQSVRAGVLGSTGSLSEAAGDEADPAELSSHDAAETGVGFQS